MRSRKQGIGKKNIAPGKAREWGTPFERIKPLEGIPLVKVPFGYGCGGSPYHALFPNATCLRADFGEAKNLDFNIKDGLLPELSANAATLSYRRRFSNMWRSLRHILANVSGFSNLAGSSSFRRMECFRSTVVPMIFRDGLYLACGKSLERSGFVVDEIFRLYQWSEGSDVSFGSKLSVAQRLAERSIYGFSIMVFRYFYRKYQVFLHKQADPFYTSFRIGREKDESYHTFVCLLASCRKQS